MINNIPTNRVIINEMVKLEQKGIKDKFYYKSVNYWPAIRIRVSMSIIEKRYYYLTSKYKNFKELLNIFKLFRYYQNTAIRIDKLFITSDNYKIDVDGKKYDRVLEHYITKCKKNKHSYAELNLTTGYLTYGNQNKVIYSIKGSITLIKLITIIVCNINPIRNKNLLMGVRAIEKKIREINSNFKMNYKSAYKHITFLRLLQNKFTKLLKLFHIKEIYQATYYDPLGLSINAAASRLNILTNCVQHGGQSRYNPAFGQWTNLPPSGYGMLPDTFLCWDKYSANNIKEWASKNDHHTAKVVGYKWAEMWKNGDLKYTGTGNIESLADGKMNILYTMQPSIGLLPSIISDMINHFQKKINWWFRLHPRQLKTKVNRDLLNSYADCDNIFISKASNEPLPAIMSIVDLHITSFSSCVYEAMAFNIPTIFIDKMGQDYFDDIIKTDAAKVCATFNELKNDIIDRLENYSTVKHCPVMDNIGNR